MAKSISSSKAKKAAPASEVSSVSAVRKTVAPRKTAQKVEQAASVASTPLNHDQIAKRAYLISVSGNGGSESDNWFRAQAELECEQSV